ncbi:MAG TPA: 2'-5' RNA ligase family protein [Pyrinomonadaceae bacterium]|nr:2'-5' RNA ligase family protein [Pyrinomonadaceae bacterium]
MPDTKSEQPLIVTARTDEHTFAFFDGLRQQHFPPERNFLSAHLTLFHKLPGENLETISNDLDQIALAATVAELSFTGWRGLGRGVAMSIESKDLATVRATIASRWANVLTAQDRQSFRPHITVQNKVEPSVAKELLAKLSSHDHPASGWSTGLELWRYMGGPWEALKFYEFAR